MNAVPIEPIAESRLNPGWIIRLIRYNHVVP